MSRLERLRARLEEPLIVTSPVNVRYLTGLQSSNAALVVEPERVLLFADFRYRDAAGAVEGVEFVETARALLPDIGRRLRGRHGFEAAHVSYAGYEALREGGLELVPRRGLVEALRAIKDESEVDAIRRATHAADAALEALVRETWIGRTERELAWRLEELMHAHGAQGVSFETIVGSGPTGALPHGRPTDKLVARGELVVVDFGAVVDGYCSDCTRTFSTGELPGELRRAYDVCLAAQEAAVEGIRAGMTGPEADRLARDRIEAAGFGAQFGHGLGHGVGMEVHEAPGLRPESADVLEPGMVVTVEPGIYQPGLGGVRIEDLAVVRDDGLEVLTSFRKELVTVE
ncbi:MAG TPA: Xaa-Pro peptidase family protein [Gaiellaceae bacterium]|nr:Xaa-Pro peptidase family protein [Gaiellaceae bacterium]